MDRRNFIRNIFSTLLAIPVVGIVSIVLKKEKRPLTEAERDRLIAKQFGTRKGREALYRSMTEPIKKKLDYMDIGNKLLMAD